MSTPDKAVHAASADESLGLQREYWAFISYRHADNKEPGRQWATWLHQALETYEVPEDLVGKENARGDVIPERIFPVFRDEEELPADAELSKPIEAALQRSSFLVVLCSPRAVQSRFVADEILRFKQLGREDRILAAIVEGEPNSGGGRECFPEPLRFALGGDQQLSSTRAEPVAADFRLPDGTTGWTSPAAYREDLKRAGTPDSASRRAVRKLKERQDLMLLKIIAGILGVPLGTLTARDKAYQLAKQRKRARQLRIWLALVSILTLTAVYFGIQSKITAERESAARKELAGTLSRVYLERGATLLGAIDSATSRKGHQGIAYLCEALETDPANWEARARLITALKSRSWPQPEVRARLPEGLVASYLQFSPDGSEVFVFGEDRSKAVFEVRSLNLVDWDKALAAVSSSNRHSGETILSPSRGMLLVETTLEWNEGNQLLFLEISDGESGVRLKRIPCKNYFGQVGGDSLLVLSRDGRRLDRLDLESMETSLFRDLEDVPFIPIDDPDRSGAMGVLGTWMQSDGAGNPWGLVDDGRFYFLGSTSGHTAEKLARYFGAALTGKMVVGTGVDAENFVIWVATYGESHEGPPEYVLHRFLVGSELGHQQVSLPDESGIDGRSFGGIFDVSISLEPLSNGDFLACAGAENPLIAIVGPFSGEGEGSVAFLGHEDTGLTGVTTMLHSKAAGRLISVAGDFNVLLTSDRSREADTPEACLVQDCEVIPLGSAAGSVDLSPDGKLLGVCREDHLEVYRLSDLGRQGSPVSSRRELPGGSPPARVVLPAFRKELVLPGRILDMSSDVRCVLDRPEGDEHVRVSMKLVDGGEEVRRYDLAAVSPDGQRAVLCGYEEGLLIDLATSEVVAEIRHAAHQADGADFHLRAVFSPDSATFVTLGGDGTFRLHEAATGKMVCEPVEIGSYPDEVVFSPDSRVLMAVGGEVRFFAVPSGTEVYEPLARTGAWSPHATTDSGGFLLEEVEWSGRQEEVVAWTSWPYWHEPGRSRLKDEDLIRAGRILCGFALNADGVATAIPLQRKVELEEELARALELERLDWEKVAEGWLLERPHARGEPRG